MSLCSETGKGAGYLWISDDPKVTGVDSGPSLARSRALLRAALFRVTGRTGRTLRISEKVQPTLGLEHPSHEEELKQMMFKSRLNAFDSASELPAVAGWMGGGHFQVI